AWWVGRSPVRVIRARVARQDAGGWAVLISGVAVSAVAVVSLGIELHAADSGAIPMVVLGARRGERVGNLERHRHDRVQRHPARSNLPLELTNEYFDYAAENYFAVM
ncbi:hypothetical protein B4Q13_22735, partial [Lacticaseibacillus rhamnosus]